MPLTKMRICMVIDASGSMLLDRDRTLDAINEYLTTLKAGKESKKASFTLMTFNGDDGVQTPIQNIPVKDLPVIDHSHYVCQGLTPLNDATGKAIAMMTKDAPSKGKDKVLMVIMTDGKENVSSEFKSDQITALVKEREKTGQWSFVFMGADLDAWQAQHDMNTRYAGSGNTMSVSKTELVGAMKDLARNTRAYSASAETQTTELSSYGSEDRMMSVDQAADYLHLTRATLARYRVEGKGPAYKQAVKRGRVLYTKDDLDQWVKNNRWKKSGR